MPRSPTCSRCLALLWVLPLCLEAATVSGKIEVQPGAGHSRAPAANLSDVIVWLKPADGTAPAPVGPERVRLLQKNKMFHPHVLPIRVGTIVEFPNADPIFHNAFSNYDGQLFDVGLYPPGSSRSVRFRRAGIVRVFCNIHPAMSAVIVALDTPYYTRVESDGQYRIVGVPPGKYELHMFDERATGPPDSPIAVAVDADESQTVAPVIRLSEAGYVRPPHKNKFGLDYPSDNVDAYGGSTR